MLWDPQEGAMRIAVARGLPDEVVQAARVRPGEGIAGKVLAANRPRLLRSRERAAESLSPGDRLEAAVSAPLRLRGRPIGVINLSGFGGDLDRSAVRVLMAFSGQAAAAIDQARLYDELKVRMARMEALRRVGQALTSSLNLSRVLRRVLGKATSLLGCRQGSLMLLTPDGQSLRIAASLGLPRDIVRSTRQPLGSGVAGRVAQTGEPVVLAAGVTDPGSARRSRPTTAAMSVPLRWRGRIVGVLNVSDRPEGGDFGPEDLEFLTALADQAALAIENARLYRRLQRKVSLANRELVLSNRQLEAQKGKLQAIIWGMADGVLVVDRRDRVVLLNPAAQAMLGIPAGEAVGRGLRRWPAGEGLAAVLAEARAGMNVVKEIPGGQGQTLLATVSVVSGLRGAEGVVVLTDVSELKRISDLKSELVSFVSHELRSPLTSILGFAQTMLNAQEDDFDKASRDEFHQIIIDESQRLLGMINEMLDVARLEAGRGLSLRLGPVDLEGLLRRVLASQAGVSEAHELVLDLDGALPPVRADGDKIYQVVTNLVSNAIKYSPEGGRVTASARLRGDRVVISVADQGLGIPPETLGRLFQRYYRVQTEKHTAVQGTGLGLYFCKGVVEAHGGSIWVESQYGKGSRFLFELPLSGPS
jgi:signal transduction histidine kinase